MTTTNDIPYAWVDGARTPLSHCIWLGRRVCGCVVTATIAHIDDNWTYPTVESMRTHLFTDTGEKLQAERARIWIDIVTHDTYHSMYRHNWKCEAHTP